MVNLHASGHYLHGDWEITERVWKTYTIGSISRER